MGFVEDPVFLSVGGPRGSQIKAHGVNGHSSEMLNETRRRAGVT